MDRLLSTYERLKKAGITPVWSINHGPTTSLYYEDPDGIRLEFQTENFPTAKATADYFHGSAFAEDPIGVNFDPDTFSSGCAAALNPPSCSTREPAPGQALLHGLTDEPSPGKRSDRRSPSLARAGVATLVSRLDDSRDVLIFPR